jgi:hypothetical protein
MVLAAANNTYRDMALARKEASGESTKEVAELILKEF